jgi:hypothetical protein
MAVQHGYGKIAGADALVFAYDTGDTRNSYRGEPTVNLIGNFVNTYNEDYWVRATNYYQLEATAYIVQDENAPGGAYTYVTGNTSDTNAQLFWSAGNTICNEFGQQVSVSAWLRGSGEVRLIAYDDTTGYKSGPAITLTDQWTYHKFSTTFGSGGTQANHWVGVREITTGEYVHVAQMQWERKSHATQYVRGTRSATQGLLDLTGNSSINLTNAAFDSSAQLTFDGTNTAVPITGLTVSAQQNKSYEAVIRLPTGYAQTGNIIGGRGNSTNVFLVDSERKLRGGEDDQFVIGSTQIQTGIWYHVTYTFEFDGATTSIQKLYINGVLDNQTTQTNYIDVYVESTQYLGYDWRFAYYFNGDIAVCKVYNKTLTAAEVANNYNHYKGRFNI